MARIRPVRAMVFRLQAAANLSLAKARIRLQRLVGKKASRWSAILKLIMRSLPAIHQLIWLLVKWRFALTTSNKTMCSFRSRYLRLRGFEGWEQPDTQPPSCRASTCALRTHWSRPVTTAAPSYTRALAGDFRKSAGESGEVTCQ